MIVSLLLFVVIFYGGAFIVEVIIVDCLLHDGDHWTKLIKRGSVDQLDDNQTDSDVDQTDNDQHNDDDAEKGLWHYFKRRPSFIKVHLVNYSVVILLHI